MTFKKIALLFWAVMAPALAYSQQQMGPVTSPRVNNVVFADVQAGSDEGAKINAAFASQGGTAGAPTQAVKVVLSPNQVYQYSTEITLPNSTTAPYISYFDLDCQGSAIIFNGAGDASQILTENAPDVSGTIENCTILNGPGNTHSTNGIHAHSRVGLSFIKDYISGFANTSNSAGLFFDEDAQSGWGGYFEHTRIIDGLYYGSSKNLRFLNDGGTGSFARTLIRGTSLGTTAAGQFAMTVEGSGAALSAYMYDSNIELRGNGASGSTVLGLSSGGTLSNGLLDIGFESASTLIDINDTSSYIAGEMGYVDGNGATNYLCAGCTSDQIQIFNPYGGGYIMQQGPGVNGVPQARNSKLLLNQTVAGTYGSLRYGIPSYGGTELEDGIVQYFWRNTTTADPEVDCTTGCAAAQVNTMLISKGGVGFGPGYGTSAATGGTSMPTYPIEVDGGAFHVAPNGEVTSPNVYPANSLVGVYPTGSGLTSLTCATGYTCTSKYGVVSFVGGTFTTGAMGYVQWQPTAAAQNCIVTPNGISYGIGMASAPTTTALFFSSGTSLSGMSGSFVYSCLSPN